MKQGIFFKVFFSRSLYWIKCTLKCLWRTIKTVQNNEQNCIGISDIVRKYTYLCSGTTEWTMRGYTCENNWMVVSILEKNPKQKTWIDLVEQNKYILWDNF